MIACLRQRRGYMLVETVTAMAILSVGVMAIHGAMRQAAITRAQAEDYTTARFLAEQRIGELELQPMLEVGRRSGAYDGKHSRFRWSHEVALENVDIDVIDEHTPPPIGRISVRIQWTRMGRPFETVVETLISPERIGGFLDE